MSAGNDPCGAEDTPDWLTVGQEWASRFAELNPYTRLFPFNYAEMGKALIAVGTEMMNDPARAYSAWAELGMQQFEVLIQATRQAWALDHAPVVQPARRDRRFVAEEWSKHAIFNAIKQYYLLSYNWFLQQLD